MRVRIAVSVVAFAAVLLAVISILVLAVRGSGGGAASTAVAPASVPTATVADRGGHKAKPNADGLSGLLGPGRIDGSRYHKNQLVAHFDGGASAARRARALEAIGASVISTNDATGATLLGLPQHTSVRAARDKLNASGTVKYAEPNFAIANLSIPNDPMFGNQYSLNNTGQTINGSLTGQDHDPYQIKDGATGVPITSYTGNADADIDAPEAWNTFTGSASTVVAVVDTGIDYNHPDLSGRIWNNPGETGTDSNGNAKSSNGIDDDHNGYVDDFRGWNFYASDAPNGNNNAFDDNFHGTHVSGTIAAAGNDGVGITGVSQNARIMPLKVLNSGGYGFSFDIAEGFSYAGKNGASVVNASLGGAASDTMEEAIQESPNTLFVFAAGNAAIDNDANPTYPCNFPEDNVICVAATDYKDRLTYFSNWGRNSVDLSAPGEDILSDKSSAQTQINGDYWFLSGTSMATPHVAGAAALLKGYKPTATPSELKDAILGSVDPISQLASITTTGGRLNVAGAIARLGGAPPARPKVYQPTWDKTIYYSGADGVTDNVTVTQSGANYVLSSGGPQIDAGQNCSSVNSSTVSCPAAGINKLNIDTRDLNDTVNISVPVDSYIDTGSGDDVVNGGGGNDVIVQTAGKDTVNGGAGNDTMTYGAALSAVNVSLDGTANDGTSGEQDNIGSSVETVRGSAFNDTVTAGAADATLVGNAGDDILNGGPGNDTLVGRDGADVLNGNDGDDELLPGAGGDTIIGGNGSDTADYSDRYESLNLTLDGQANDGAPGENDNIDASVENLVGGYGDDTLVGNSSNNRLDGSYGSDTLVGGAGDDDLSGGSQPDVWTSHDTVSYASASTPVHVTADGTADDGVVAQNEHDNVEPDVETIIGGSADDVLTGGPADNLLIGNGGNDDLRGGAGNDAVSYEGTSGPVTAVNDGSNSSGVGGEQDRIGTDVEGIIGSQFSDQLNASDSGAFLVGLGGDDVMTGGAGKDRFDGGTGNDQMHGGAGTDEVRYAGQSSDLGYWWYSATITGFRSDGISVSLDDVANDGWPEENDNVGSDIENVIASTGNDTVIGDDQSNYISGQGGDDTIYGGGGNDALCGDYTCGGGLGFAAAQGAPPSWKDTIYGGDGNDFIDAGWDADHVYGGNGDDTIYSGSFADDTPTWYGVDSDVVSGDDGNDTISSAWADDTISGGNGNDTLNGEAGNDTLQGDAGTDTYDGGDGNDQLNADDGTAETPSCGDGTDDTVYMDTLDVQSNCEHTVVASALGTSITSGPADGATFPYSTATYGFSSPNPGVTFECSFVPNGSQPSYSACTSPARFAGSGLMQFSVRAKSMFGQVDVTPATRTVNLTNNAVVITAPLAGHPVNPAIHPVTWTKDASVVSTGCDFDAPFSYFPCYSPWSAWGLSEGTHDFSVQGTDALGNIATATVTATVDNTPPFTIIDSKPSGWVNSPSATTTFHSTEPNSTFQCSFDNGTYSACSSPKTLTGVPDGGHSLGIKATDEAGNVQVGVPDVSWMVDTIPPVVTITSPANGSVITSPTPALTYSVTELNTPHTEQCSVDGGAYGACPSTLGPLAVGSHTVSVKSTDPAGNVGTTTSAFSVIDPQVLTQSSGTWSSSVNLTSTGTADWGHWGSSAATSWDHKTNGGSTISNMSTVGTGCAANARLTGVSPTSTWTDGTPTASSNSTTQATAINIGGGAVNTVGCGYKLTVPVANTEPMTMKLYVGVVNSKAKLDMWWSSTPGTVVSSTELSSTSTTPNNAVYTITMRPPRLNDTLNIKWSQTTNPNATTSRVRLYSATLDKLAAFSAAAPSSANLTSTGTLDWAHWGSGTTTNSLTQAGKSGGTDILTPVVKVGTAAVTQATATTNPVSTSFNWTNGDGAIGSPVSTTGTQTGISTGGASGSGFYFTVPAASASMKTLKLYVGVTNTQGKLDLFWGSNTTSAITDTSVQNLSGTTNAVYTINLRHVAAGTTLKVQWVQNTTASTGRVTLQSAALY